MTNDNNCAFSYDMLCALARELDVKTGKLISSAMNSATICFALLPRAGGKRRSEAPRINWDEAHLHFVVVVCA